MALTLITDKPQETAGTVGAGSSPGFRVTISGNRPRCGYVSCWTTQS